LWTAPRGAASLSDGNLLAAQLSLMSCSGLSRTGCWPPQGSATLYDAFDAYGTLAILGGGVIGLFLLGWGGDAALSGLDQTGRSPLGIGKSGNF
jgi:hypothetical protein